MLFSVACFAIIQKQPITAPMTSSHLDTNNAGENAMPVARIEAQNTLFAEPLREYLESHGCQVLVNRHSSGVPHYLICVGDTDFVKSFYEGERWEHSKKLAIIYEGLPDDLVDLRSQAIKYYFVDPKPLNEIQVRDIFAFFFTGRAVRYDSRKDPSPVKRASVITPEPRREQVRVEPMQESSDKQRIAETMRQVFHTRSRTTVSKPRHLRGRWVHWVSIGLLIFFLPLFLYTSSLSIGAGLLGLSGKTLLKEDARLTKVFIQHGTSYLQAARMVLHFMSPALVFVGAGGIAEDQDRFISILSDVSKAEVGALTIFDTSKQVAGSIFFPEQSTKAAGLADVTKLTTEVSRVSQHLALISAQLDLLFAAKRFPFNTHIVSQFSEKAESELFRVREIIGYTEKLLTMYPRIGGFRRKQTYLVLLQNSMELRPTGGFIGSLLLVSFIDGRVETLEVQDVYTADGQLKGHIDPPLPIREILGQEHWYLRDSNWNPDFSISGKDAAWFYEKEMGVTVDGVIAISLPMVTKLLAVTGPIELLDFNERISESNFFAKSLLYTQTDFFPGSTQKKDFLGALTNALLTRITTDRTLSAGSLLHVMTEAIQSRDIQFYFTDTQLQELVNQWDWGGAVHMEGDSVGLVEANLGVNKTNFFVMREALSQITIEPDGSVEHAFTVKVTNDAPQLQDGTGGYQNYMRVLMPLGATVREVSLDGVMVPIRDITKVVPPSPPYWFVEDSGTYQVVHIPLFVAPQQTRQVSLSWVRANALVFDNSLATYKLTLRKQSGVAATPWNIIVRYPPTWSSSVEGGIANASSVEYNTTLTKDETYSIVFQKNL